MRFLMLNWRDPRNPLAGGAERVTLGYMAALAERGHDVSWFAYDFPGAAAEERIQGVRIIRRSRFLGAVMEAFAWTRHEPRFDLVIDQHHGIPWFAPWWCRTRCVAYIHEVLGPIWDAFYPWPLNWIGRTQERWIHRLYRKVPFWTACRGTQEDLRRNGIENITVIPYGVHTRALSELEPKELTSPLRLAVVSRLAPNKRIDHAVRTVHALHHRGVSAHLTVVGTGEDEKKLRHLAAELGIAPAVTFTGPLPESDKDAVLRSAHFLLHTSQREGWGLNVIEANAMGTPAAVYPVKGLTESTLHNETGWVAERETPEALAEGILVLFRSETGYQTLRENAWARAKAFHWNSVLPYASSWLESIAQE